MGCLVGCCLAGAFAKSASAVFAAKVQAGFPPQGQVTGKACGSGDELGMGVVHESTYPVPSSMKEVEKGKIPSIGREPRAEDLATSWRRAPALRCVCRPVTAGKCKCRCWLQARGNLGPKREACSVDGRGSQCGWLANCLARGVPSGGGGGGLGVIAERSEGAR